VSGHMRVQFIRNLKPVVIFFLKCSYLIQYV